MVCLVGGPTPENVRKFAKNLVRKLQQCIILDNFQKIVNPALIFRAFGPKIQIVWNFLKLKSLKIYNENSIRKLNFLTIFGIVAAENRAFGDNINFYKFSVFGGFLCSPWRRLSLIRHQRETFGKLNK